MLIEVVNEQQKPSVVTVVNTFLPLTRAPVSSIGRVKPLDDKTGVFWRNNNRIEKRFNRLAEGLKGEFCDAFNGKFLNILE